MVAPTMPQFTKTSCDSQHFVTCNRDELPIIDNNGINCRNGLVVREPVTWIGRWEAIFFQGENPAVYGGREADNSLIPPSVAV